MPKVFYINDPKTIFWHPTLICEFTRKDVIRTDKCEKAE
jgi:hypothetical protein